MDIKNTSKYRKAKQEFQCKLYAILKILKFDLKDYESYKGTITELMRTGKINKSYIAKKNGLTPQRIQNWVNRHDWGDLSNYIHIPSIIVTHKVKKKANSYYSPELLENLQKYASELTLGGEIKYSNLQLAELLGISNSSFYNYYKNKPQFADILDETRAGAKRIFKYERALDERAFGINVEEVKTKEGYGPKGSYSETTRSKKKVLGDVNAIKFGLTNIAPDKYSNNQKVEQKIKVDQKIDFTQLSDKELEEVLGGK